MILMKLVIRLEGEEKGIKNSTKRKNVMMKKAKKMKTA